MEEKLICCCGSSGWAKVIGWFQVIGNAFLVIIVMFEMLALSAITEAETANTETFGTDVPSQFKTSFQDSGLASQMPWIYTLLVTLLLGAIVNVLMGIVLLKGSYKSKPNYLQAWIIYAHISLIVGLIIMGVRSYYINDSVQAGVHIMMMALSLMFQGFFIWVVRNHKVEMESTYTRMDSIKA